MDEYMYIEKAPLHPTDRELRVYHVVSVEYQTTVEIHEQAKLSSTQSTMNALRRLRSRGMVESVPETLPSGKTSATYWRRTNESATGFNR